MTSLFNFLSRLTEGQDESIKKVSWLFFVSSTALVAGLWCGRPNQATSPLFVLSLIGYLASAVNGMFLYIYLALDLRRFVVQEGEYDVWVAGDSLYAEDEETQSTQERRWLWSERIKALLLLFQMASFLTSTLLLCLFLAVI